MKEEEKNLTLGEPEAIEDSAKAKTLAQDAENTAKAETLAQDAENTAKAEILAENAENTAKAETSAEDAENTAEDGAAAEEPEADENPAPKKTPKEEAYDWLYDHHVTVKMMDAVLVIAGILLVIVVILGRRAGA